MGCASSDELCRVLFLIERKHDRPKMSRVVLNFQLRLSALLQGTL